MVWFIAGVYVAAGMAASLALLAAAFGPWGMAVLATFVAAVTIGGIEAVTHKGDRLIKQAARELEEAGRQQAMAASRPHSLWRFITWSVL